MHPLVLAPLVSLPWLQGFFAPAAETERPTAATDTTADIACLAAAGALSITADVALAKGRERITASFAGGVVVVDAAGRVVARAPGLRCAGSADRVVGLAAGDAAIETPVVAIAMTAGGHNENTTTLTLYRVARDGELEPVFSGDVEHHLDDMTRTGVVVIVPGGLVYRAPQGTLSLWTYDEQRGRYLEQLTSRPNT